MPGAAGAAGIKTNGINLGKRAKDGTTNDIGLECELLISKGSPVMITRNLSTLRGLLNSIMGTVYDLIWEDGMDDLFATMPAVILAAVNNYLTIANGGERGMCWHPCEQ